MRRAKGVVHPETVTQAPQHHPDFVLAKGRHSDLASGGGKSSNIKLGSGKGCHMLKELFNTLAPFVVAGCATYALTGAPIGSAIVGLGAFALTEGLKAHQEMMPRRHDSRPSPL